MRGAQHKQVIVLPVVSSAFGVLQLFAGQISFEVCVRAADEVKPRSLLRSDVIWTDGPPPLGLQVAASRGGATMSTDK